MVERHERQQKTENGLYLYKAEMIDKAVYLPGN